MPAARAIWSGSISFGLVNIPVKLYTATETKDISFTSLHATCRSPLKRPYMCPVDNVPVESKEMVKGYPVGKAQYVILTEDEIESVRVESSAHINVNGFVESADIGPLFYESTYYLGPLETSVKPFELFRQALLRTGKVALAQATMWRKEHMVALRPVDGALVLTTLYYADEVKSPPEPPATKPITVTDDEILPIQRPVPRGPSPDDRGEDRGEDDRGPRTGGGAVDAGPDGGLAGERRRREEVGPPWRTYST